MDTGDFKDKQFTQGEVADKVVEQYDEFCARVFYKVCMGGGDANNSVSDANDIHYGVYTNAADTVYESSKETNKRQMEIQEEENAGKVMMGFWGSMSDMRPIRKSVQFEAMGIQMDLPKQILQQESKFVHRVIKIP